MANDDFFDRDDLFDDFDDDNGFDDDFDDDLGGELGDDFDFDDDLGGTIDFGDEDEAIEFDDDDDVFADSGAAAGPGLSRGFIIIAAVMIIILLLGIALIIGALTGGPNNADMTRTAVKIANDEIELQIQLSETQNAIDVNNTQIALSFTPTASSTPTATNTPEATVDVAGSQTAQFEGQIATADALATGTAVQATANFEGTLTGVPDIVSATPTIDVTMPGTGQPVAIGAVEMTATALAGIFETPIVTATIGDATPTVEDIGGGTPGPTVDITGTLPDTGLFDDVFGSDPTTIFLAAFGLLGVIVVSRRIRKRKRR